MIMSLMHSNITIGDDASRDIDGIGGGGLVLGVCAPWFGFRILVGFVRVLASLS